MKLRSLLLAALVFCPSVGAGAYALTPPTRRAPPPQAAEAQAAAGPAEAAQAALTAEEAQAAGAAAGPQPAGPAAAQADSGRLSRDGTLKVEAVLGHASLPTEAAETYVLVEVQGADQPPASRTPAHMALVLDQSGSMEGARMRNAIEAAVGAVKLLSDGDMVSVVSFDDFAREVCPPTVLSAESRAAVEKAIRRVSADGNTCVSCGVEAALKRLATTPERLRRMIVLSDGEANLGAQSLAGFQALAGKAREASVVVSTVGLGAHYNERLMTALAMGANGRAHDAASEAALGKVFEAEAEGLRSAVASAAALELVPAEGAEVVRVFDRASEREGERVTVPLGAVARGERKVVLASVRVAAGSQGPVVRARLRFRDLVGERDAVVEGELGAARQPGAPGELRPEVSRWLLGSQAGKAVAEASKAFEQGKLDQALGRLDAQQGAVQAELGRLAKRDDAEAKKTQEALRSQAEALAKTKQQYQAAGKPSSTEAKRAVKDAHAASLRDMAY